MNEAELRARVESRRTVSESTWHYLDDKGYLGEAVEEIGEAEGDPVGYLLKEIDAIVDAAAGRMSFKRPPGRMRGEERVPAQLKDYEIERSEIFSEYLAKIAATNTHVRRFRAQILDDQLLSPEQARALLLSPAAAHWHRDDFDRLEVRLLDHTCKVKNIGRDEKGPYSLVEVSTRSSEAARLIKDRRSLQTGRWEVPTTPEDATSNRKAVREVKGWKVLPLPGENGYTDRTLVHPVSVLGYLHKQVSRLVKRYPWEESEAVWFVLTGEPPWVAPMTWQTRAFGFDYNLASYGFITLKIEPWVSAETVLQSYRHIQRGLLGGDNRPLRKNLKLLRFVIERTNPASLSPKERARIGGELVAGWDQENPREAYGQDTRRFWRDYDRARQSIALPDYKWRDE